jgi:hypothetical protein
MLVMSHLKEAIQLLLGLAFILAIPWALRQAKEDQASFQRFKTWERAMNRRARKVDLRQHLSSDKSSP